MNGSTVIAGMTPAGNVYTATRDLYFTNLTINSGITLQMAQWRLFVTDTLSGPGSGTATITTSSLAGFYPPAGLGGAGGSSAVGSPSPQTQHSLSGANGGHGGTATTNAGGAASGAVLALNRPHYIQLILEGIDLIQGTSVFNYYEGGNGGGGGGGNTGVGGAGGSGGGILVIVARVMVSGGGTLALTANGGNGANGVSGTAGGGGGGGGGGAIIVCSQSVSPGSSFNVSGITTSVAGGTFGAPFGTATNAGATNGSTGSVILIPA
jgi:hypothetical protein